MSSNSEHEQLLLMWAGATNSNKVSLDLPNKVTSSKKGPLSLNAIKRESQPPTRLNSILGSSQLPPPPHYTPPSHRRSTLTRFPVKMLERPMELVERELGTLSCAQLKDSLQVHSTDQQVLTSMCTGSLISK